MSNTSTSSEELTQNTENDIRAINAGISSLKRLRELQELHDFLDKKVTEICVEHNNGNNSRELRAELDTAQSLLDSTIIEIRHCKNSAFETMKHYVG